MFLRVILFMLAARYLVALSVRFAFLEGLEKCGAITTTWLPAAARCCPGIISFSI